MFKVISRASIVPMLLGVLLFQSQAVRAQVAPTNTATISGSVSDVAGKPVTNARIALSGPKNTTAQTDAHGLFVFVGIPFGTYQLSAAAEGLGTVTRSVSVQGDTNVAIQYEPAMNGLKVIANVASAASASFNITPASVTELSPLQNAFKGRTSWRTILEQIPGVIQAGLGNGSNSFDALPDGNLEAKQISINGALPYETAVLFDDMPLIGGSYTTTAGTGTNIGLYPLNGFTAADVVRGPGANAPSIVNSIGGSFVLHAPGAVNQNQYEFSFSGDPYGGIVANAFTAMRWHKLSAVLTYGINDSPGPTNQGVVPAFTVFDPTAVNGAAFSPFSAPCSLPNCEFGFLLNPNLALDSFPFFGRQQGLLVCCSQASTAWSQHSGSLGLNYALSPSITAAIAYSGQITNQRGTYPNFTNVFAPPLGYNGNIPAGQMVLPELGNQLGPVSVQQASSLLEEKVTAQIGKGNLRLAALQNRTFTSVNAATPATLNLQLFGGGQLCSDTSPGCSTGTFMPAVFNGETYQVSFPPANEVSTFGSNNRDLLFSYATPLGENFHAGVSFVKSYYNSPSNQHSKFGAPINEVVTQPTSSAISQTTNETRIFFGGNPSDKTSIDLSMYFARANYHVPDPNGGGNVPSFSLSGGVLNIVCSEPSAYTDARYSYAAPRLGFVWRPTAAIAIRAAAGGGFAEAPLQDLVGSNGTPTNFGHPGFFTVSVTNLNLQPEKSFSFDLGTDIRMQRNTVLSFDIYRSNLYGQFYSSSSLTGTFLGLPLFTTQFGNLGKSRYEGILVDLRHASSHGFSWALSGALMRAYLVSVPSGFYDDPSVPCTNCKNLTIVPGINFNGEFAAAIPYSQAVGTLGYHWNAEKSVDVVATYYGNGNTYFRPAFVEIDGHVNYPLNKNVSLLVTLRNMTGIYDRPVVLFSPENMSGAPTVSGLPDPLYGEEYGPRAVILTINTKL